MATIRAVLGRGKEPKSIIVRVRGSHCDMQFVTPYSVKSELWDAGKEQIRARASVNPQERLLVNNGVARYKAAAETALYKMLDAHLPLISENFRPLIMAEAEGRELEQPQDKFFRYYDEFAKTKEVLSYTKQRAYAQIRCHLERFSVYMNKVKKRKFTLSLDAFNETIIEEYRKFLLDEYLYIKDNEDYYAGLPYRIWKKPRGYNNVAQLMHQTRAFWNYCLKRGYITTSRWKSYTMPHARYGTPFFLYLEELDQIAQTEYPTERLNAVKDIFLFQSFTACRKGDLFSLKKSNVHNGVLEYMPHKTTESTAVVVRVPLNDIASDIVAKYAQEEGDALLPFSVCSENTYYRYIKDIVKGAGITREVAVLNGRYETEYKPIYEVAASHLARRNFVGNLYDELKDPGIISEMSGHAANSEAFRRYMKVSEETKKEAIALLNRKKK